jgi:hypothetical protein
VPRRLQRRALPTELHRVVVTNSAGGGSRTHNSSLKRRGLCQLSYTSEIRGLESNQHLRVQSAASLPLDHPGIQNQYGEKDSNLHTTASKTAGLPLANPRAAAVAGVEPAYCALTERRLTIRLHTAVGKTRSGRAPRFRDARPPGVTPCARSVIRPEAPDSTARTRTRVAGVGVGRSVWGTGSWSLLRRVFNEIDGGHISWFAVPAELF